MRKLGRLEQAAKVIALCLPPVVMSLIGLATLSRTKGGAAVVAGKRSAPARPSARRTGAG
jgi:hypothetical protein